MISKCALCDKDKQLIEAHIIPKWAFKYLYPEGKIQGDALILVGTGKLSRSRIGLYDREILCSDCDGFFGIYDGYAKEILINHSVSSNTDLYELISGVDIEKIRIFLLSVLWRAAVSNLKEFSRISIGPYRDILQKYFIDALSGRIHPDISKFSFIVTRFLKGNLSEEIVEKNILVPHTQKIDGINTAVLYLPRGLKIYIKLDRRRYPQHLDKISNYRQGNLIILKAGDFEKSQEYRALISTIS